MSLEDLQDRFDWIDAEMIDLGYISCHHCFKYTVIEDMKKCSKDNKRMCWDCKQKKCNTDDQKETQKLKDLIRSGDDHMTKMNYVKCQHCPGYGYAIKNRLCCKHHTAVCSRCTYKECGKHEHKTMTVWDCKQFAEEK